MYNHILVPIAPDHERPHAASVDLAKSMLAPGGKITGLTVVEPTPAYIASMIPQDVVTDQRAEMLAQLNTDLEGVENAEAQLVIGHAGATIVDYAQEHGADCILIASHKPGLEDFFLGSTASRVVRHATCSVHVMR